MNFTSYSNVSKNESFSIHQRSSCGLAHDRSALHETFDKLARTGLWWRMCSLDQNTQDRYLVSYLVRSTRKYCTGDNNDDIKEEDEESSMSETVEGTVQAPLLPMCIQLSPSAVDLSALIVEFHNENNELTESFPLSNFMVNGAVSCDEHNASNFVLNLNKSVEVNSKFEMCCALHCQEFARILNTLQRSCIQYRQHAIERGSIVNTTASEKPSQSFASPSVSDIHKLLHIVPDSLLLDLIVIHSGSIQYTPWNQSNKLKPDTVDIISKRKKRLRNSASKLLVLSRSRLLLFESKFSSLSLEIENQELMPLLVIPLCKNNEISWQEKTSDFEIHYANEKRRAFFRCASVADRNNWFKAFKEAYLQRGLDCPLVLKSLIGRGMLASSIRSRWAVAEKKKKQPQKVSDNESEEGSCGEFDEEPPIREQIRSKSRNRRRKQVSSQMKCLSVIEEVKDLPAIHKFMKSPEALQNQGTFFQFVYANLYSCDVLLKSNAPSEVQWKKETMKSSLFASRGRTITDVDNALNNFLSSVFSFQQFIAQSFLFGKDTGSGGMQSMITFAFPSFDTHIFAPLGYSIVEIYRLFRVSGEFMAFSESQWDGALRSSSSVGKELMQSTPDVTRLFETGNKERAKSISMRANEELLRNLCLATFCAAKADKIAQRKLKSFTWNDVLARIGTKRNKARLNSFPNVEFTVNPSSLTVHRYWSERRSTTPTDKTTSSQTSATPIIRFVCTPMHMLHLLRFQLLERRGRIDTLLATIRTWEDAKIIDKAKSTSDSKRSAAMHKLTAIMTKEAKQIDGVLDNLPSIKKMITPIASETTELAVF